MEMAKLKLKEAGIGTYQVFRRPITVKHSRMYIHLIP